MKLRSNLAGRASVSALALALAGGFAAAPAHAQDADQTEDGPEVTDSR